MMYEKILVAIEPGPLADSVAKMGLSLAEKEGAKVMLLHVVDPAAHSAAMDIFEPQVGHQTDELTAKAERRGRQFLDQCAREAHLKSTPEELVVTGRPAEEIIRMANDWHADLVVVGSHGRSGLERLVLGSIAETILRDSSCDVLVVKKSHLR